MIVAKNARQARSTGLNDTAPERSWPMADASGWANHPGGPAGAVVRQAEASRTDSASQSVLHAVVDRRIGKRFQPALTSNGRESRKQTSGTISLNLTRPDVCRIMWRPSARRRRGLTRDVSRTSVSGAGQPSQRADRARLCKPERPLLAPVVVPVGPRVGGRFGVVIDDTGYQIVDVLWFVLTCFRPCARIPSNPRSGIWIGSISAVRADDIWAVCIA
jgi:hypothetical protein